MLVPPPKLYPFWFGELALFGELSWFGSALSGNPPRLPKNGDPVGDTVGNPVGDGAVGNAIGYPSPGYPNPDGLPADAPEDAYPGPLFVHA